MSFLHEVVAHFSFDPPPSTQATDMSIRLIEPVERETVNGAADGIDHASELDENPISRAVDDTSVMTSPRDQQSLP